MMGVDDFQVVRQTLDNLEYYDELDLISLPLIKNILKDLQDLSKHCAEIELENEELKKKQVNNFDEVMETSKNADPLNDTYLLEVVDSAKSQIEKLQVELNNVKHENEKLKESTKSGFLTQLTLADDKKMGNELKNLNQTLCNFLSENGIIRETIVDLSEIPPDMCSFSREMVDIAIKSFKSMKTRFELTEKNFFELSQLNIELSSQLNLVKTELMAAKSSVEECQFNKFAASKISEQLEALEDVNLALQTKLKSLEELRLNYLEGNTASLQSHISSSLEILCTEVATEVHFTSHLNQLIEKMNKRRLDQEENISIIRSELKEARENMKSTSLELLKCKSLLENETRFKLNLENEILMLKNALNGLNDAKNNSELTLKSLSAKNQELVTKLKQGTLQLEKQRKENEHLQEELKIQDSHVAATQNDLSICRDNYKEIKTAFDSIQLKEQEAQKDLLAMSLKLEKSTNDLNNARSDLDLNLKRLKSMEDILASKRKEKDLMMNTHFKLIKSNEKMLAELNLSKSELTSLKKSKDMDSIQISKLTTELNESKAKIGEYNKKISQLNDLIKSYESNLHTTDEEMRKLKITINSQKGEIIILRETIQSLENLKKENYFQLAKATEALSDLRKSSAQLSNSEPKRREVKSATFFDAPLSQIKEKDFFESVYTPKFNLNSPLETSLEIDTSGHTADLANGLVKDWQRKNEEIKIRLKELQKELEGDRTMTIYSDVSSPNMMDLFGKCEDSNARHQLEKENRLLMDIVSQVKSDLQKANLASPSVSVTGH